jgi:methionyl-tRNA formyltransferase
LPEEQEESEATLAPKISKEDRPVRWDRAAADITRQVLALSPRPGATAFLHRAQGRGEAPVRLSLLRAAPIGGEPGAEPGVVVRVGKDELVVGALEGGVALLSVKPAGKRELDTSEFVRGYRPAPGDRFDPVEVPR